MRKQVKKNSNISIIETFVSDVESELYNLAWFTTENNKSYSIDTKSGLSKNEFEGLLDELIWNVITMEKWEEHNIEN